MDRTPPILYIIYKNGSKGRINLIAQTPDQRRTQLKYWANTSGTHTAFLAWK